MSRLGFCAKCGILLGGLCLFCLVAVLTDGWALPVVAIAGIIFVTRLRKLGCLAKGCVLLGGVVLCCIAITVTYRCILPGFDRWRSVPFARAQAAFDSVCAQPIPASLIAEGHAAFSRSRGALGVGRDPQYAIRFDASCDAATLVKHVFGMENVKDGMWEEGSSGYDVTPPSFTVNSTFDREWAELERRVDGWKLPRGVLANLGGNMYCRGYRVTVVAFPWSQGRLRVYILLEGGIPAQAPHVNVLHVAGPKPGSSGDTGSSGDGVPGTP